MKKKLLAILLTALLVVSVVLVLAACQKEYTVTFRDTSGRELDTVTTVKGKATATDKATTKAGYTFEDWYKTIGQDDDGNYTYTDKVDLATYEFTEDTDLYAKWKRNITAGEEAGYCIIGKITGLSEGWTNGGFDPEAAMNEPKAQLTHATDPINLYTITLDVKALDSFKIKTNSTGWSNIEINGLSPLLDKGSVTLKSGVNLPEGVSKASDLFTYTYDIDNNVSPKCDMNITINFYYNASESYADLIVNSIDGELVKPVEEVGYAIAGSMNKVGDDWKQYFTAAEIEADPTLAQYVFTADAEKKSFTTTVVLHRNDSFQIKVNESGWSRGQYGADAIESVTYDEALDEAKKPDADASVAFSTTGNIVVYYDLTAVITITADGGATSTNGKITIVITDIDPTGAVPVEELGGLIVGDHNGWALHDSPANVLAYDDASETFKITGVQIGQDKNFQVKINENDNWARGQFGYGAIRSVTIASTLTDLPVGITKETAAKAFSGEEGNVKGNIKALYAMTISVTLDYEASKIDIEITAIATSRDESAPEAGFTIAGTINGWGNETPRIEMTANTEKTVFTKEGLVLPANAEFQIKNGEKGNWNPQFGAAVVKTIALASGVTLPTDVANKEALFNLTESNIKALKAVTVTVTLNWTTKEITITVTAIASSETPAAPEAKIGTTEYATLAKAIAAVQGSDKVVIELLKDVTSGGIMFTEAQAVNVEINLGSHTLTIGKPLVGSAGTVSQNLHFEKGNTVVIKNGTITTEVNSASMLLQNYCNLTLDNVILDGSKLAAEGKAYTLSNNCGTIIIKNGSRIIACETKGVAFDVYYGMFEKYEVGVSVTVEAGCTITGAIEYGADPRITNAELLKKAVLVLPALAGGNYTINYVGIATEQNAYITIGQAE